MVTEPEQDACSAFAGNTRSYKAASGAGCYMTHDCCPLRLFVSDLLHFQRICRRNNVFVENYRYLRLQFITS